MIYQQKYDIYFIREQLETCCEANNENLRKQDTENNDAPKGSEMQNTNPTKDSSENGKNGTVIADTLTNNYSGTGLLN